MTDGMTDGMTDDDPDICFEVILEDGDWSFFGAGLQDFVQETTAATFCHLKAASGQPWPGPFALSVTFLDDAAMREINKDTRGKDKPTNVLSFPAWDGEDLEDLANGDIPRGFPDGEPLPLGDILIAQETVAREAREQDKQFGDHTRHLLVHGVLHLVGYDHMVDDEAEVMERLEIDILKAFAIPDPYLSSETVLRKQLRDQ